MADVVDLLAVRRKREGQPRRSSARTRPEDFGGRLARIRASLDKINRLMTELRQLAGVKR